MAEERPQRHLAALLAADVVGYSRLTEQDEAGTFERLRSLRKELFEPEIEKHKGHIFKLMGDGLLAEFASVVDAVECAVVLQHVLAERNDGLTEDRRIDVRIGVNLGDVIVEGDDRHGEGVNIAARLQQLADPGGIAVSRTVFNHVKNKLALGFESLGEHQVKNIAEPLAVYRVQTSSTTARPRLPIPPAKPALRRWRLPVMAGLALVLPTMVGVLAWNTYFPNPACVLPLPDKPSIAVLPFDNLSDDPKWTRLTNGIAEDVILNLSRSSDLFVIAWTSTRSYKDHDIDVRQIGCDLGVKYVLDASLQDLGDGIRVTPQLIEAANRSVVWSEPFDRPPDDIFHISTDLAAGIAERLLGYQGGLPEEEGKDGGRKPPTDNLEAYDYYLRAETLGRGWWSMTKGEALAHYQKAIDLDPQFADAYAGYARIAADAWLFQFDDIMAPPVARKEAYRAASRALALDPDNPRPYSVLSALQTADGRHDQAVESARKAISLQPSNAEGYAALARALTYGGNHAEALAAMETALRLDPNPSPQFRADLGWVLAHNGRHERALEQLEAARRAGVVYPDTLAMVQVALGRVAEARATVQDMLEGDGGLSLEFFRVQLSHYRRKEDLDRLLDALRAAGLPQWPIGYPERPEHRLFGGKIRILTFGRTWKGQDIFGRPFVQEVSEDGKLAFLGATTLLTGSVSVRENRLCRRTEAFLMGREYCGYVYRNPHGTPAAMDEYAYVSAYGIFRFSVLP